MPESSKRLQQALLSMPGMGLLSGLGIARRVRLRPGREKGRRREQTRRVCVAARHVKKRERDRASARRGLTA